MTKSSQFREIPIDCLRCGQYQPRRDFDHQSLNELALSIKSSGIIQPIVVRPLLNESKEFNEFFEIIAGERRWRAAQIAGLIMVPCLIKNYSDEQAAAVTLVENIQRRNLNPIEEAKSIQKLIDEFNYGHEEVAEVLGKSRTQVSNMIRLLRLEENVQKFLIEGSLSEGHGKILASLPQNEQIQLAKQCVEKTWSVRQLETYLKRNNASSVTETKSSNPPASNHVVRLENALKDQLGTEVKIDIDPSSQGGWLKIQFYNNEILNGLLEKMGILSFID